MEDISDNSAEAVALAIPSRVEVDLERPQIHSLCGFELVIVHVFPAYHFSAASFGRTFLGYQFHFFENSC